MWLRQLPIEGGVPQVLPHEDRQREDEAQRKRRSPQAEQVARGLEEQKQRQAALAEPEPGQQGVEEAGQLASTFSQGTASQADAPADIRVEESDGRPPAAGGRRCEERGRHAEGITSSKDWRSRVDGGKRRRHGGSGHADAAARDQEDKRQEGKPQTTRTAGGLTPEEGGHSYGDSEAVGGGLAGRSGASRDERGQAKLSAGTTAGCKGGGEEEEAGGRPATERGCSGRQAGAEVGEDAGRERPNSAMGQDKRGSRHCVDAGAGGARRLWRRRRAGWSCWGWSCLWLCWWGCVLPAGERSSEYCKQIADASEDSIDRRRRNASKAARGGTVTGGPQGWQQSWLAEEIDGFDDTLQAGANGEALRSGRHHRPSSEALEDWRCGLGRRKPGGAEEGGDAAAITELRQLREDCRREALALVKTDGLPAWSTTTGTRRVATLESGLSQAPPEREYMGKIRLFTEFDRVPDLHISTLEALAMRDSATVSLEAEISQFYIFTDGSAGQLKLEDGSLSEDLAAGWAFAVIARHVNKELSKVGFAAGLVPERYEQDPLNAEIAASIYALRWAAEQLWENPDSRWEHRCMSDCMANIKIMNGSSSLENKRALAAVLQHVTKQLDLETRTSFGHVRAHSGHPWNEFCDAASKAVRLHDHMATPDCLGHVEHLLNDEHIKLRFWELGLRGLPQVSLSERSTVELPHVHAENEYITKKMRRTISFSKQPKRKADLMITFATANVTSALDHASADGDEPSAGINRPARTRQLREAFLKGGLDVIGLQETRTKGPHDRSNTSYVVRTSGCRPGAGALFGCELWIKKSWTDEAGRDFTIKEADVVTTEAGERHLFASVTSAVMTIDVLVAHAPCAQGATTEVEEFWQSMLRLTAACRRPNIPVVVLTDANVELRRAPLGQEQYDADDDPMVGEVFPLAEEATEFQRLLWHQQLFIPYSFKEYSGVEQPEATSYNVTMHGSCIDYVALPQQWKSITKSAAVDDSIDISIAKVNHLVAKATVLLPPGTRRVVRSRRSLPYNAREAHSVKNAKDVAMILEGMPTVSWAVDVSTHAAIVESYLLNALKERFPPSQARAAPEWMTGETAELLESKKSLFKAVVWFKRRGEEPPELLKQTHRQIAAKLKAAVKKERADGIASIQKEMADCFEEGDMREAFRRIKMLQHYKPKPSSFLKKRNGERARDAEENAEVWLTHWAQKMDGKLYCPEDLMEKYQDMRDAVFGSGSHDTILQWIPRPDEIANAIGKMKERKAHGEDLMAVPILKRHPKAIAEVLHQLAAKTLIGGMPPVQWQGGCLIGIPKSRTGPLSSPDKARGIVLGSHPAKAVGKVLRSKMERAAVAQTADTVCGGVDGRGTDVALHARRQFCEYIHRRGCSGSVLFIDLTDAFGKVQRGQMEGLFSESELSYIAQVMHRSTWATVPYSDKTMLYEKGVRQGDPLSDIIFIMTAEKVLRKVRRRLEEEGLLEKLIYDHTAKEFEQPDYDNAVLGPQSMATLSDIDYMDDLQFYFVSQTPARLLDILARATQIVKEEFELVGHQLNFSHGKTEAIVMLKGNGVRQCRDLLRESKNILDCGEAKIRIVAQYNNLGNVESFLNEAGKLAADAAKKLRMAKETISRATLKNPNLSMERKSYLVDVMLAKGLYGAETWPLMTGKNLQKITTPYMQVLRSASNEAWEHGKKMKPSRELYKEGFAPIAVHLRIRRLRYVSRYLQKAPRILRVLTQTNHHESLKRGEKSWVSRIKEDLTWIWERDRKMEELPDPEGDVQSWLSYICSFPLQWKKQLSDILGKVKTGEINAEDEIEKCGPCDTTSGFCPPCGQYFATPQGFAAHCRLKHGIRAAGRAFVEEDLVCWSCGHKAPNRARALQHYRMGLLRKASGSCLAQVVLAGAQEVEEERLQQLEAAERERARKMVSQGRHPADADYWSMLGRQVEGPRLPVRCGPLPWHFFAKMMNAPEEG
eukprot:TRINITY_DN25890_c0_g1_i1.p1 TRINITY_DN25890_c0_g1~~TRINITY_DN25890_c0_g1_i1.p1  ORF type:complete len:1958 (-),score=429.83 TRINITY_DN25890_c0_g1_i1:363-6236(-)